MRRQRHDNHSKPAKMAQTFFAIDADTHQPVCFITGTSSRTVTQARRVVEAGADILQPQPHQTLVLADAEHFTAQLLDDVHEQTCFDLSCPCPPTLSGAATASHSRGAVHPSLGGYATASCLSAQAGGHGPFFQFVQRLGERPRNGPLKPFWPPPTERKSPRSPRLPTTLARRRVLQCHQPSAGTAAPRTSIFATSHDPGPGRSSLISQLRSVWRNGRRLGCEPPGSGHLPGNRRRPARQRRNILVTCYNAPHADRLRDLYEDLPAKLEDEHLDPRIPWLYNFKLDFRFRYPPSPAPGAADSLKKSPAKSLLTSRF